MLLLFIDGDSSDSDYRTLVMGETEEGRTAHAFVSLTYVFNIQHTVVQRLSERVRGLGKETSEAVWPRGKGVAG